LINQFRISNPRIYVSGLNPHAGENGLFGLEEINIIAPAIMELRENGIDVNGPFSADSLFHHKMRSCYDAVICMYHDQALIPIKTISFDDAVNITLGLPFVRTSPDHGTAMDIAGKDLASAESLISAIRLANKLTLNDNEY
jgi:4-hydroxythreonine-4-phosphate dehydrogenase